MPKTKSRGAENAPNKQPVTWGVMAGMLTVALSSSCTTGGYCRPTDYPEDHPCHERSPCEVVDMPVLNDAGEPVTGADGGPETTQMWCGCCNG